MSRPRNKRRSYDGRWSNRTPWHTSPETSAATPLASAPRVFVPGNRQSSDARNFRSRSPANGSPLMTAFRSQHGLPVAASEAPFGARAPSSAYPSWPQLPQAQDGDGIGQEHFSGPASPADGP